MRWFIPILVALVLFSPVTAQDTNLLDGCVADYNPQVDYFPDKTDLIYTEGFTVEYFNHYKVVTVTQPWRDAAFSPVYVLVQCGTPAPEDIPADAQVVEIPVERSIVMSTTFLPTFDSLGIVDTIVGLDESDYANTESVRERIDTGEITEVGEGSAVNVEVVLSLEPGLVLDSSTGNLDFAAHPVLQAAGVPTVLSAAYTESSPLARVEWIKYNALFYNREAQAAEEFDGIAERYIALREDVAEALEGRERPTVTTGLQFQGAYYTSGGNSYFAQFLQDAGADFVFGDDPGSGSRTIDFEVVFEQAGDAEYWLNGSRNWTSLDTMIAEDARYAEFAAVQNGNVFNNVAFVSELGGNAYFELGYANPDIILSDLVRIFHPDILPDHELVFYLQLD